MVTYSRAGRGKQGMASLLPFSILRFPGFKLIQACHFSCLSGNKVPHALHRSGLLLIFAHPAQICLWAPERCPRVNDRIDSSFYSEHLGTYLPHFSHILVTSLPVFHKGQSFLIIALRAHFSNLNCFEPGEGSGGVK